jgi:uncharacterized protein
VRLTAQEVAAIKVAARETFGDDAVVRLFGSRVHDHLRGGDIDLHIETGECSDRWVPFRSRFISKLHRAIGERSIDVLVYRRGDEPGKFDREAVRTGVVL